MSDDRRSYPILYVDDEPQNLFTFRYALEDQFTVLTANSGREALRVLEQEEVAVLLCDQRMPEMTGVEVCRMARDLKPDVVRIMVTAYADLQATIDAINQGQVLKYMTKPWRNDELVQVLESAIEMVRLRRVVQEMQARVLRGAGPPMIEAVARQIAAELRTPLSELGMSTEQVSDLLDAGLSSWGKPDRAQELVEHAAQAQRDSRPPLAQLESIARKLERGQRLAPLPAVAACDVVRVARATVRILTGVLEGGARVQLVASASPLVRMEAADLGQVLVHLIVNAAQALQSTPAMESRTVSIQVSETEGGAEIAVCDQGPGIAHDQLERIFDPHVTTRNGAAGLGLSIVQQLVTQAGGSVRAESATGSGARFVLRLPRAASGG